MTISEYLLNERQNIRRYMQNRCADFSYTQIANSSKAVAKLLVQSSIFQSSENIACYFSRSFELNTKYCIRNILNHNKHCYLPALSSNKNLNFINYTIGTKLTTNRVGIMEPPFNNDNTITPDNLDLVLVPLSAFDKHGNRLGSGFGYYDRTFNFTRNKLCKKPFLCGLAYAIQEIEELIAADWDVPLHAVITENAYLNFSSDV